jgi:hypothetical protein
MIMKFASTGVGQAELSGVNLIAMANKAASLKRHAAPHKPVQLEGYRISGAVRKMIPISEREHIRLAHNAPIIGPYYPTANLTKPLQ